MLSNRHVSLRNVFVQWFVFICLDTSLWLLLELMYYLRWVLINKWVGHCQRKVHKHIIRVCLPQTWSIMLCHDYFCSYIESFYAAYRIVPFHTSMYTMLIVILVVSLNVFETWRCLNPQEWYQICFNFKVEFTIQLLIPPAKSFQWYQTILYLVLWLKCTAWCLSAENWNHVTTEKCSSYTFCVLVHHMWIKLQHCSV